MLGGLTGVFTYCLVVLRGGTRVTYLALDRDLYDRREVLARMRGTEQQRSRNSIARSCAG